MEEDLNLYGYNLPYRFYLMPQVDGQYGYLLFVATHAFFDGMSIVAAWQAMTKDRDFTQFKRVGELSVKQKIFSYAMAPIGLLRVILQILTMPFEKNCIKSYQSGKKIVRISDDVSIPKLRLQCK